MRVLQTLALPLGYAAGRSRLYAASVHRVNLLALWTGASTAKMSHLWAGRILELAGLVPMSDGGWMKPTMECRDLFLHLGDDEVCVVDCRDDDAWNLFELHIPGALHITLRELSEASSFLPDDELIVLAGCEPDGSDARRASRLLRLRGRSAVCLSGGLHAWVHGGYPTERHRAAPEEAHGYRSRAKSS